MAHEKIKAVIVFLTIFIIVGGISWALVSAQQSALDTEEIDQSNNMPKLRLHEDVRDLSMSYIKDSHPETTQHMVNIDWTGGKQEIEQTDTETYSYTSDDWKVTINYPITPNPTYEITINYSITPEPGTILIPYAISWSGVCTNWVITETSYTFAQ